jgi:hypothetical protein
VTVCVDADVDVSLADVESEDLIAELEERKAFPARCPKGYEMHPEGTLESIADVLARGDIAEAALYVERIIHPKWKNEEAAKSDYLMACRKS